MDPECTIFDSSCQSEDRFSATKIFPLIHALKEDIIVNSALSWDQLTASDVHFSIIKPLVEKYAGLKNLALVYSCLVVRSHFLRMAEDSLAHFNLNNSRAMTCELLAIKFIRYFASNKIELVAVLTHSWNPLSGAPRQVVEQVKKVVSLKTNEEITQLTSALEMAISTDSKRFLSTPLTQTVVNDIYSGRVVFTTAAQRSLVADNYKQRGIEIYDCRNAPFLDHYRLRVPRYSAILEIVDFAVLFVLFILCLATKELRVMTVYEIIFILFGAAFALKEYTATLEHGWRIYLANTWTVFDASFILVWLIYLVFRIKGLVKHDGTEFSFDILACGACILFPRYAHLTFLQRMSAITIAVGLHSLRALRGMIADFAFFITIASICFSGLLFTLWELAQLTPDNKWTMKSIAWLMTQIWFGNTSLTFQQAESFHPVFGPILMVTFAALSNTLLLTILVSILSNTFARIDAHLFQFTISTIEGVKSDALFSYQPPFNLAAYVILAPLSYVVSPRTLHTTNVLLIRLTTFPILVTIALYERYIAAGTDFRRISTSAAHNMVKRLPRHLKHVALIETLVGTSTSDLCAALFDIEIPPMSLFDSLDEDEDRAVYQSHSHESLNNPGRNRRLSRTEASTPSTLRLSPKRLPSSSPGLRLRAQSTQRNQGDSDPPASPLTRLYARRLSVTDAHEVDIVQGENMRDIISSIRRVERTMETIKDLPVERLRTELKELQDRQTRIENLLLALTRDSREDLSPSLSGTI
ncbi:receptor-activated Ca2+-permeable cation channel [Hysterangium stoloniferum]|nr:receptor-activated Ca2+-permeable cation channel [Hysterangium stoloniferum]